MKIIQKKASKASKAKMEGDLGNFPRNESKLPMQTPTIPRQAPVKLNKFIGTFGRQTTIVYARTAEQAMVALRNSQLGKNAGRYGRIQLGK